MGSTTFRHHEIVTHDPFGRRGQRLSLPLHVRVQTRVAISVPATYLRSLRARYDKFILGVNVSDERRVVPYPLASRVARRRFPDVALGRLVLGGCRRWRSIVSE